MEGIPCVFCPSFVQPLCLYFFVVANSCQCAPPLCLNF